MGFEPKTFELWVRVPFMEIFYVWKNANFSYCASLCYLFLPTLLLTVTRKKFCDHFLKYEKECLYLWHLCIPWSYAQKNTNYSSPEKIVSQIIEKCKGHDLYYWNIDVGHSSLNVLCILIFLIFCLFTLQWYRKSWPLAFLQLF